MAQRGGAAAVDDLKRDRKVVLWVLAAVIAVLGALYVAGYVLTGDHLPRGTSIGGVPVGGMAADDAIAKVSKSIDPSKPIAIRAEGHTFDLVPSRAGITPSAARSVAQVNPGRSWRPSKMWQFLVGGGAHDVVTDVDDKLLSSAIDEIATKVDQAPVQGAITFGADGAAVPVYPAPGVSLKKDDLQGQILDAFPTRSAIDAEVEETQPDTTSEEVSRAMEEFANPALAGPVVLALAGQVVNVEPSVFAPALSVETVDGKLQPQLDNDALIKAIDPLLTPLAVAPKDAGVQAVGDQLQVTPAQNGVTYDPDSITSSFLSAVVANGDARHIDVATKVAAPGMTDDQLAALGIKEIVSDFTTYYPEASTYRDINQGKAADTINGTILKPGDTFSLNGVLGERTVDKGYVDGGVIEDGVSQHAVGGGISQVATTTFNAMFFAGLKNVEHKPHSYYISRYPAGREATVNWDNVDLKFTNDTPYGVLIQAWRVKSTGTKKGELHVRMWSTKTWDIVSKSSKRYAVTQPKTRHLSGPTCEPVTETASGFQIDVYRRFFKPGSKALDHEEKFHTTYIPIDRVVCDG